MTIDSIGVDLDNVMSLGAWLESEDAQTAQRQLEEKITELLFGQDLNSPAFLRFAAQLAWIGSRPDQRALLEKEICTLNLSKDYSVEPCDLFKDIGKVGKAIGRAGKKAGNFVADHAAEIAVGVAIVATGAGIAVAAGYTLSVAVGGVVVAGASSIFQSEEKPNPHIPPVPLPDPKACSQLELSVIQQPPLITLPKIDLPSTAHEILVTADGIWASGQFFSTEGIMKHSMFSSVFQKNTLEGSLASPVDSWGSDWKTFHAYLNNERNGDLSFQARGESALVLGNYDQAVHDLGKAIEANPTDPLSYLERGAAHFGLGEYDRSLEDYQLFTSQSETTNPLSVSEFCVGFAKGLPKGAYESGKGMLLFLVDFVNHPIQTSKQVIDSINMLADLVRSDEWGAIGEALSPEMHHLVMQWNTLPSDQRGELAGYAVGKLGADILLPGGLSKVASKSVKSAQELVAVCKNLQIVQETLILETAAGIGSRVKIAEVVQGGQLTAFFAEELGLTTSEMGQLKQAGQLETTVFDTAEKIAKNPVLQDSVTLHKKAQEILKPNAKKSMSEIQCRELIHQTGIKTFSRPEGIPENYLVRISDRGAGMEYVHPTNKHLRVRVMPGKPHSPFPYQQKPYIIQMKDGKAFDRHGNLVPHESPEAHIPLNEFTYRH